MRLLKSSLSFFSLILIFTLIIACEDKNFITEPDSSASIKSALEKITYSDEILNSFVPNYNEEQAMSLTGQLSKTLYPIKIGQVVKLVDRNLQIEYGADTAVGKLTLKFEGELIIMGSFNDKRIIPDTIVKKPFTSIIARIIKYAKVDSTGDNLVDWKIIGSSLAEGGTETNNIEITKLTLTTLDGKSVTITSPNEFFFDFGRRGYAAGIDTSKNNRQGLNNRIKVKINDLMPFFGRKQPVTITLEVKSIYEKPDFVTITHGAMVSAGMYRTKEKFELKDTQFDGTYYIRTYEKTWLTHLHPGFIHAVINLLPDKSVTDTDYPVEEKTWGLPYVIK
ncbi:hypothetical protein VJY32_13310 [Ignavibacteria bacterium 4148-Me]|uniref:hypothetical protein n=1 Tax=Rosettibacter primus TaxID=3111523 RepID=UPI00336C2EBB